MVDVHDRLFCIEYFNLHLSVHLSLHGLSCLHLAHFVLVVLQQSFPVLTQVLAHLLHLVGSLPHLHLVDNVVLCDLVDLLLVEQSLLLEMLVEVLTLVVLKDARDDLVSLIDLLVDLLQST